MFGKNIFIMHVKLIANIQISSQIVFLKKNKLIQVI